jgi:hypothetical protein
MKNMMHATGNGGEIALHTNDVDMGQSSLLY